MSPTYTKQGMRQSLIGDFDICQLRAQFNHTQRINASGQTRAIGTAYHAALEAYYLVRQARENSALGDDHVVDPDEGDIAFYVNEGTRAFDDDVNTAGSDFQWDLLGSEGMTHEDSHGVIEKMVRVYFEDKLYWPADWKVLGVEHRIEADWIDGWAGSGTIDLLLQHEHGWVNGVDHKTAKRKWSHKKASPRVSNQAAWYVKWLREELGHDGVGFVFDVMKRDASNFQRIRSEVDDRHVAAVTEKAKTVATLLDSGLDLPPNQSSNLCSPVYCDFWTICPYGAALD